MKSHGLNSKGNIGKERKSVVTVKTSEFPEDVSDSEMSSNPTPQKIPDSSESMGQIKENYADLKHEHISAYLKRQKENENIEDNSEFQRICRW